MVTKYSHAICFFLVLPAMLVWTTVLSAADTESPASAASDTETTRQDKEKKVRPGFHFGNVSLHTLANLTLIYDSNVNAKSADFDPLYDLSIMATAGLKLNVSGEIADFTLKLVGGYHKYFGLSDAEDSLQVDINGNTRFIKPSVSTTDYDGELISGRLTLWLWKDKFFSILLNDKVERSTQPENTVFFEPAMRTVNEAQAGFRFQPKPKKGNVMIGLDYHNVLNYYDDYINGVYNYVEHRADFRAEWLFLPKTGVFLTSRFSYYDYFEYPILGQSWLFIHDKPTPDPMLQALYLTEPDACPLEITLGFVGRLAPWFSMTLSAGYNNYFASRLSNYHSGNAKAEFIMMLTDTTRLLFGGVRRSRPIPLYGYVAINKGYLNLRHWAFDDRLKLSVSGSYAYQQYGEMDDLMVAYQCAECRTVDSINLTQQKDRKDHLLIADASVSYDILTWLTMSVAYKFTARFTSADPFYLVDYNNQDNSIEHPYEGWDNAFVKHQVLFTVKILY